MAGKRGENTKLPYSGWPNERGAGVRQSLGRLQRRLNAVEDRDSPDKVGVSLEGDVGEGVGVAFDLGLSGSREEDQVSAGPIFSRWVQITYLALDNYGLDGPEIKTDHETAEV